MPLRWRKDAQLETDECADDLFKQFVASIDQPLLHQAAKSQLDAASIERVVLSR
jgi:hypothetical protein